MYMPYRENVNDLRERDKQIVELTQRKFIALKNGQKHEVGQLEKKIRKLGQSSKCLAA